MRRIIIIGCPGAGKSTFARTLGKKLNIPVHHLDTYFWRENWTTTPQDEFRRIQNDLMAMDTWILEGNFTKSIDNRIPKADTIIVFDFPKYINLWRTFKRFFQHFGQVRPEMGGGNKETLQWKHIRYIITFPRKEFEANIQKLATDKKVIVLRAPPEAAEFLDNVGSNI